LSEFNIQFKTEEQLREENSLATPDIFFIDPVFINGIRVHWIEAKCHFGVDIQSHKKKLVAQLKRHKSLGPGAVVYKAGFCDSLQQLDPEIVILDGRCIS